ncbi:DUF1311 domain-containing protein [Fulvivirga maritima]|uniref:lysozyme inhibitor LprI family protein n=1 Tax=Fulvivirga maritima TaxID=2904247 RepID=UPI001F47E02C|nr:lysozyme inhibitor LprI family protein [Fulvivirga maritima]UII26719.1 DUF1311 domain-containing protein [Fulvivirga maritima]
MMKILIITALAFITSLSVKAQNEHAIDLKQKDCLQNAISTMDMIKCQTDAGEAWDKELNKYYQLYMAATSEENKIILKAAQREWMVYRDKEYELINHHYYIELQGTMWRPIAAGERAKIIKERALQLKNYYEELDM